MTPPVATPAEPEACECDQTLYPLTYTPDDRWLVFGRETVSPLLVLGVMLAFSMNETMGKA